MTFLAEPPFSHGSTPRSAVLLINLGTPEAPTPAAVRRYLREFLSDPRVVEIPRVFWLPLLHGVILNVRPRRSAAKYASIWTERGSPLRVHSEQQALLLRGWLGERGMDVEVALAMRYGSPSIAHALEALRTKRVERLLVLPLYPQYSATTTATAFDAVHRVLQRTRNVPEVRWVKHFHGHPGYIEALKRSVTAHWQKFGRPHDEGGKLVMSFHGVPQRTLTLGDPYHCECQKTARLLAASLGLEQGQYEVSFQSRFGRAQWLQPYTAPLLQQLARNGCTRVDVVCPGFVADCLETLEEIAQECRHDFLAAGGKSFHYIGCLNDSPAFIDALADLVETHMAGWPVRRTETAGAAEAARVSSELARGRGAER